MKATDPIYNQLKGQDGLYYDVQVSCNNINYGLDKLKSVKIHNALYDGKGISVGNAYSASCEIQVMEQSANWPRMASFSVKVRRSSADGTIKSNWLNMGTFYTDERSEDTYGNLSILGYDKMLMTEQYWTDKIDEEDLPDQWPITAKAWVDLIEDAELIQIDASTDIDDNEKTGVMRLTTNTDAIFGIRSIDGNRYYKGSQITLRQRAVI